MILTQYSPSFIATIFSNGDFNPMYESVHRSLPSGDFLAGRALRFHSRVLCFSPPFPESSR
jgi:hypothetical protein